MPPKMMPGKAAKRHIEEAHNNYLRYQRWLNTADDAGWAAVALFYSALHLAQAHATAKCKNDSRIRLPETHTERKSYIANHCRSIEQNYFPLQDFSLNVRYSLYKTDSAEILQLHDTHFLPIKIYFEQLGFGW